MSDDTRKAAAKVAYDAILDSACNRPAKEGTGQRMHRYADAVADALAAAGLLAALPGPPDGELRAAIEVLTEEWENRACVEVGEDVARCIDELRAVVAEEEKR